MLKPLLGTLAATFGLLSLFATFSWFWDAELDDKAAEWLATELPRYDESHPLSQLILQHQPAGRGECTEVTPACVRDAKQRAPMSEGQFHGILRAWEDPRPFSSMSEKAGEFVASNKLIEITNRWLLDAVAHAGNREPDIVLRMVRAQRERLVTAPSLIDKMIVLASFNLSLNTMRLLKQSNPQLELKEVETLEPSETSFRRVFAYEFQHFFNTLDTNPPEHSNLFFKHNYSANHQFAIFNTLVERSEFTGCALWSRLEFADASFINRALNPVGEVLVRVAQPAYAAYPRAMAGANLEIALTNAFISNTDLNTWQSPFECWQAHYDEDNGRLCLQSGPDIPEADSPVCSMTTDYPPT